MIENKKRKSIIALIVLLVVGVIIGIGIRGAAGAEPVTQADTVYTVKGIHGNQTQGFYVRYYDGEVKLLPGIKTALNQADSKAERRQVRREYQNLETLHATFELFGANNLFN